MSNHKFLLTLLFLPLLLVLLLIWWIYWKLYGKKQAKREQKRQKQTKKLLTHIKNFSPVRLKNKTWQKSIGKGKKKHKKFAKTRKASKNNLYGKKTNQNQS